MQVATHCETGGAELRALETGDGGSLTPGSGISTLLPPWSSLRRMIGLRSMHSSRCLWWQSIPFASVSSRALQEFFLSQFQLIFQLIATVSPSCLGASSGRISLELHNMSSRNMMFHLEIQDSREKQRDPCGSDPRWMPAPSTSGARCLQRVSFR